MEALVATSLGTDSWVGATGADVCADATGTGNRRLDSFDRADDLVINNLLAFATISCNGKFSQATSKSARSRGKPARNILLIRAVESPISDG